MLEWMRDTKCGANASCRFECDFGGTSTEKREFMGANHATLRLGRAMRLRKVDRVDYDRLVSARRPPIYQFLEACRQINCRTSIVMAFTFYGAFTIP